MYQIFLHTLMNFYEFINIRTAKYDGVWTLHTLLTTKNHMTLSLFTVYTVKCQIFTIRDVSMHFGYATGCFICLVSNVGGKAVGPITKPQQRKN